MNSKECAKLWKKIVSIYEDTRDETPKSTMDKIISQIGLEKTKEIFATVAAIKVHDGRIYGENREYMKNIPINADNIIWERSNAMIYAGLDNIHMAHINQLITELRKIDVEDKNDKKRNEKTRKRDTFEINYGCILQIGK